MLVTAVTKFTPRSRGGKKNVPFIQSVDMSFFEKDETTNNHEDSLEEVESDNSAQLAVNPRMLEEGSSYVIVEYEGSYFPGLVTRIMKTSVEVRCMMKKATST